MVLRVAEPASPRFERLLAEKVAQAPGFFRGSPVVIDLEEMPEGSLSAIDLAALVAMLKAHGLMVVGVRHADAATNQAATLAGLALFPAGRASELEAPGSSPQPAAPQPVAAPQIVTQPQVVTQMVRGRSRVITEPVRSGQQIYHGEGDLIVMAAVGAGAEVIAEGNIHVYGALRGRAIAGVGGDAEARIWCTSLDAELVSVAGIYMVSDRIDPALRNTRVLISAAGDTLAFERLP
jgi:septum site-determining protein MinC